MKKFKIGVIGVGGYSRGILNNYILPMADEGKWDLVGAVVRTPSKYKEMCDKLATYNCKIYATAADMYKDNSLDMVFIPTGIEFHLEHTTEALSYGINVLVEKPAAGTTEEVYQMIEAEQKSNNWVAVGFQNLSSPELWTLKQYLLDKKFGKISNITVMGRWPRNSDYYNRNNWAGHIHGDRGTLVYDSPANNAFAHFINYPLFLLGKDFKSSAEVIEVNSDLYRARPIETFDTCSIKIKTNNDVELLAIFSHSCSTESNPIVKINCENATIYHYLMGYYEIFDNNGELIEKSNTYDSRTALFEGAYQKLIDSNHFVCQLSNALQHTKCIEMLHETANIIDVPAEDYDIDEKGQYAVKWIDEVFEKAFAENKMISEIL